MQLSDFHYDLPDELIAQHPSPERTGSRLLTLNRETGAISHRRFIGLLDFLQPHDILVFNNTKVIPARLIAHKLTGAKVEILVERILDQHLALVHLRNAKKPEPGTPLIVNAELQLTVQGRRDDLFELEFDRSKTVLEWLEKFGHVPLPPYIGRQDEQADQTRYQTVYARYPGAVAAPTAGLHFDLELLRRIADQGIDHAFVTLHVGAGTFQPVRVADITQHKMHKEWFEVSAQTCEKIAAAKARGGRVIAVGTTAVRCLETAAKNGALEPMEGETDIFIYPGYQFKAIDALITNFHLPESTLLMLVAAFAGYEHIMQAYRSAVEEKYRFFSYGDAMLIY